MPHLRGLSLLDLIGLPVGLDAFIPDVISVPLEKLAVQDLQTTTTPGLQIHRGTVMGVGDAFGLPGIQGWPLQAPGLQTGLPFQLTRYRRLPGTGDTIEPAPLGWQLDLILDHLSITVPRLKPARRVDSSDTTPRHLVPDTQRSAVRIVGSGVLRICSTAPFVRFVQAPDPLDPEAPAGAVVQLAFDPPHFFLGGSKFGMTVDRLAYDGSAEFTPAAAAERGQGADWQGLLIREATVYLPPGAPVVGDLSAGVRDLILGSPMGLQGELQVEFGMNAAGIGQVQLLQSEVNGGEIALPVATMAYQERLVTTTRITGQERARVQARAGNGQAVYQFTLPDGQVLRGPESPWFEVADGDTLQVQSVEQADNGEDAVSTPIGFHFHGGVSDQRPTIRADFETAPIQWPGGEACSDVLFISGRLAQLQGIGFAAQLPAGTDPMDLRWRLGSGIGADLGLGQSFRAALPPTLGKLDLVLLDKAQRPRRLRIELVTEGPVVIGGAVGGQMGAWVLDDDHVATPVALRAIEACHDATRFAAEGLLDSSPCDATIDPTTGQLESSTGTQGAVLAAVLDMGHPDLGAYADPPDAALPQARRHVQVLMACSTTDPVGWGVDGLAAPFSMTAVQDWARAFGEGARFVVIGRTCDIGGPDYNAELARRRAQCVADWLQPVVGSSVDLLVRGEYDAPDAAMDGAVQQIVPPLSAAEADNASLIAAEHPNLFGGGFDLPPRPLFRRVDIHVVGGSDAAVQDKLLDERTRTGPALRRALLPGGEAPQLVILPPAVPQQPYRVRLSVKWDSPTLASLSDAVPTLAEVRVSWPKRPDALPQLPDDEVPGGLSADARTVALDGPAVFTLVGRWTYDARSGATRFSLAFDKAGGGEGLFTAHNDVLATALLLAPPLLSGVTSNSPSAAGARLATLLGGAVAAAKFIHDGRVVVHGLELQEEQRALGRFGDATHRVLVDYTAELSVDVKTATLNIHTTNPLKVRFRRAGLEWDGSRTGLSAFNLVYDEAQYDVADPGEWVIDGKLGKLLRVAGTRSGSGSTWFEIDLEFALDLGPVRITGTTVRITLPNKGEVTPTVEIRGLGVALKVPQVLEGEGRLTLGADESFKTDMMVKVIPADVEARASLVIEPTMQALEVAVKLPTGIPLAATGVGIFGFLGRFVLNGARNVDTSGDPVDAELAWYAKKGSEKYSPAPGQFALGLGVVIGTLPDTAFTLSGTGMLTVAFPDPEVVISVDGRFAEKPTLQASEEPPSGAVTSAKLLGLVVANPHEFVLALRGGLAIPDVLTLDMPVSGFFPINDPGRAYYLRIGCDGVNGRAGAPVTATLLPGILDAKAWLYLMVEERGLKNLGNATQWGGKAIDLHGYALGFGAGFDLNWSAGPFSLGASAAFILGLGTKPLTMVGLLAAEGTLDLVLVSASVSAMVQGQVQRVDDSTTAWLDGEFRAEVDLGITTVSGALHFNIDQGGKVQLKEPEFPLTHVDLVDRRGMVTGRASADSQLPGDTVWPDTTPVLHFAHKVVNGLQGSAFDPKQGLPGPDWSGASELQVAYRLKRLLLRTVGGQPLQGPLDCTWWWPTHKGGLISPSDPLPSSHEARALALLSWNPGLGSCALADGGAGGPGDPRRTLGQACTPPLVLQRNRADGGSAQALAPGEVRFATTRAGEGVLPTQFIVEGSSNLNGLPYADLLPLLTHQGFSLWPGRVQALGTPITVPGEALPFTDAWELPRVEQQQHFIRALRLDATLQNPLVAPALTLAVWDRGDRGPLASTRCDHFEGLYPGGQFIGPLVRNGWSYEGLSNPAALLEVSDLLADGRPELSAVGGMTVRFTNSFQQVSLNTAQWMLPLVVRAFDASGALLLQTTSANLPGQEQQLQLDAPAGSSGIRRVTVAPQGAALIAQPGRFVLREVCATSLVPAPAPGVPVVTGSTGQQSLPWPAQAVGVLPGPGGGTLRLYRYAPSGSQAWTGLQILTYEGGHVLLLGVSGVDAAMKALADQNEAAKAEIHDLFNRPDAPAGQPASAKPKLLQPGTAYEIEVECEYAVWLKSKSQPTPTSIADLAATGAWKPFSGGARRYRFSIAKTEAPAQGAPTDLVDERQFDARGLQRFLLGFEPDGGLPHFLADPIRARFSIDYADRLAALYGRTLKLALKRTDPPAGALCTGSGTAAQQFQHPPELPIVVSLGHLGLGELPLRERWLADPTEVAGCIPGGGPRGRTMEIDPAVLVPAAEFDLQLLAPDADNPAAAPVQIARGHFRSSRYSGPAAMLQALGLWAAGSNPLRPHDLMLQRVPVGYTVDDPKLWARDRELEQLLAAWDLDPLPVPRTPRLSVVWAPQGSAWLLAAVLLDWDEPTERGARMRPGHVRLHAPGNPPKTLGRLRSTASGTRLLYAPAAPLAVAAGSSLEVSLFDRAVLVSGRRALPALPRAVYEESV